MSQIFSSIDRSISALIFFLIFAKQSRRKNPKRRTDNLEDLKQELDIDFHKITPEELYQRFQTHPENVSCSYKPKKRSRSIHSFPPLQNTRWRIYLKKSSVSRITIDHRWGGSLSLPLSLILSLFAAPRSIGLFKALSSITADTKFLMSLI